MAGALTAAIAAAFSGGAAVATDPYFEYTTLLLPGNGTNGAQNNTFLDGSTNNFTITRNGNTTQGTFSPFSQTGWGNYFDGNGDWLSIPANSAFDFGTGDFTVECWFYYNTTPPASYDYLWAIGGNNTNGIALYINNGQPRIWNGSLILSTTGSISGFTWYHLAAVRSSGTLTVYLNGTSIGSVSLTSNLTGGASAGPKIAKWDGVDPEEFTGYISNFRIVKGVAVYTGAFTPPTSPLAATQSAGTNISAITGTQTSLLTCQSNRFIDNSTNNFTITRNGDTRVVAFSPFNPTASWSAATNGGSGYFDGSADFLTGPTTNAAFDFGADPFTIEFWIYPTSFGATQTVVASLDNATAGALAFGVQITTSGAVQTYVWNGSSYFINVASNTGVVKLNAWNYVAVVRSGANFGCFVNGNREGSSTTISGTQAANRTLNVGRDPYGAGSLYVFGYLSNIRIVKGTAVYDPTQTTITVPTAPLTAITNTSLLLNFTNAGVYDATSKNDLETVGDAQMSNTTAKWGSTSIKFDGTGDYLTSNPATTDMYAFGSGDFTIEFWMYISVLGTNVPYDQRTTGGSGATSTLYITSSTLIYYVSGLDRITSSTLSTGQWYHVAVARSGTSTKMFINGTQAGSTYTDSTVYTNSSFRPFIGGDSNNPGANGFNGYIQDLRITKGYARYTANFTPPTAAFPTL